MDERLLPKIVRHEKIDIRLRGSVVSLYWLDFKPFFPSFSCHHTEEGHVGLAGGSPSSPVLWRRDNHGLCRARAVQVGSAVWEGDSVV